MKKITHLLLMLLSITAFSQVEIVEDFDALGNNQVPAGWTNSTFGATTQFPCGGTGSSMRSVFTSNASLPATGTLTSPNYTAISNGTDVVVSFTYNIWEQVSQFPPPTFSGPTTGWGSLVMEYSTDGGSNWIAGVTIDDNNYTYVDQETCTPTGSVNLGTIANGSDFQVRFVFNLLAMTPGQFAIVAYVDNVSITQTANSAPNCNATLISPANGSTTADTDASLTWQAATGLPTGYTISVGTTSGGTDIVNAVNTTETNYSLDGLGLAYETEYFVNIVPFNGIGTATGCTEESFTTRVAPIAGATCGSPIVVSSFPFVVASDDTANYENNVNTGSCAFNDSSYMLGNDVFYEITPSTDVSINIDLANISNNGAGMHLMKGCPTDVDKECVDWAGTFSTTGGSLNITEAVLFANETYFLVLSNSSGARTYSYSLIITQNSCINPAFTLSTTEDCANDQFFIDVDVSYLGTATDLTISDNFGNSGGIGSTGLFTDYGPYPSGTTVEITLTNVQDNSCFATDSIFYYCPPSNDECADAIDLTSTINTDDTCTLFTSATNAGATDSTGDPATCNGNTNDVWFSFVANGSAMILEYLNVTAAIGTGGTLQSTELLEGSCGTLTSLACFTGSYVQLEGLTDGNTYYIRNKTNLAGEFAQNFDICLKTAPTAPTNDECANATVLTLSTDDQCDNQVSGTTVGATVSADNDCNTTTAFKDVWYVFTPTETAFYEFSYERLVTSPTSNYTVYEGSCGALTQLSANCNSTTTQILSLTNGQSYYIMVRSANTGPGIDFNLCVYQLPPAVANSNCSDAISFNESTDSNGNNTISGNLDNSYYSPEGCASSTNESVWYSFTPQLTGTYNFNFTRVSGFGYYTVYNTDDCSQAGTNYVTGITSCFNSTTPRTGELVAGNTYLVMIFASAAAEYEFFVYPDPSLSVESTSFESFKYYPNPVINTLTVEAKNTISSISVFNIVGQQVQVVEPNTLKSELDMNALKDGVYFVTITINNSKKTIKVIKK